MDQRKRAQSVQSRAESQKGLVKSSSNYRLDSLEGRSEKSGKVSSRAKEVYGSREDVDAYKGATQPANGRNWGAALFDILISSCVLYFAVFGFLAYAQNGTMASLPLNQIIFKMAGFNPTIFPIIFTLIVAKFMKACAQFKLERGATIGTLEHLLGSRSFGASFLTPLKHRSMGLVALAVFLFWCLNPVGGQLSLKAVSKDANYTTIATNFHYVDFNDSPFQLTNKSNRLAPINSAFTTALFSPATSKNGSQDLFGGLQIPLLEVLKEHQKADSAGWYRTGQLVELNATSKALAELEDFLNVPNDADVNGNANTLVYASLTGIPFLRGIPVIPPGPGAANRSATENTTMSLSTLQERLFGAQSGEVVNTESQFNIETSYFYLDCKTSQDGKTSDASDFPQGINKEQGIVSNGHQFSLQYDTNHTLNSTAPQIIQLTSWSGHSGGSGDITKASCGLSTTYVEANIYCSSGNNCSVQAVRASLLDHPSSSLSQLDGITPPFNDSSLSVRQSIPQLFFSGFIAATGNTTQNPTGLSPIECYFVHPENPYQCSFDNTPYALHDLGNELFSHRLTQLLNTYWMDNVAQYSVTGNFTLNNIYEDSLHATVPGQTRIETEVLRCYTTLMEILVAISILLFFLGLATAYLDATRRGPDILEDFVSVLRHSPYMHVEAGSSMEDGCEKAHRLRNTLVRLGDVRPDDPFGFVAIGTPSEKQPVRVLQHERQYR
ncbi:uncharacterized protein MYCFIDRAFT_89062 [Pseudocercospora fijiensis CIRAD86]|uniref:Uncharacterized protein n=1 Tax=Pseudocercospora fijiensis (strain CIRAD86) TaxID=383855 RepID=M3AKA0_PSEFD|nr:uncharacterized protein MYCFIDRAFT_89062 [Pseudocercospora fijiensis CIRAD86]EME77593.1 hypothetical protein MYCFIDRAFT_89062 [Pseudocercospora fijiensis CIRAD86]